MDLLSHFPTSSTPRSSQVDIINKISAAVSSGKKYIIVQAPTGTGKSFVAATLSRASTPPPEDLVSQAKKHALWGMTYGVTDYEGKRELEDIEPYGCAVLTCSKALQNQYVSLFKNDATALKGKSSYQCQLDTEFTTELAPCHATTTLTRECKILNRCPLFNARRDAVISKFQVFNYSLFINLPSWMRKKEFLVCDEATELEDELVSSSSVDLDYNILNLLCPGKIQKLTSEDPMVVQAWLTDVNRHISASVDNVVSLFAKHKNNKLKLSGLLGKLKLGKNIREKVNNVLESWFSTEYIVEYTAKNVKITPVYVIPLARKLFEGSKTVILMSATIIEPALFAKTLGITDYEYIEVDSEFDPNNSPIYCSSKSKLTYATMDVELPKVCEQLKALLDHHKDDKGIIHTHTFKITQAVRKALSGNTRMLYREVGVTNEDVIASHMSGDSQENSVIVSPSLAMGLDLVDDAGRFSIIMKTPYAPMSDKRVKLLFDRNPEQYQWRAIILLVQMCGRCTRHKDDHSITYILDAAAIDLIKQFRNKLPKYFINRIK